MGISELKMNSAYPLPGKGPKTQRINAGGNYCGFNAAAPSFLNHMPKHNGKGSIPRVLTLLAERVSAYFSNPDILPTLAYSTGRSHKMRAERRCACLSLLGTIIANTDVQTLLIGRPSGQDREIISYTLSWLANRAGLTLRRSERALKDLKDAGIIIVAQQRTKSQNGEYKSQAAIKGLNLAIFNVFGLKRHLEHAQRHSMKKLKQLKQRNKEGVKDSREKGNFDLLNQKIKNSLGKAAPKKSHSRHSNMNTEERRRFLMFQAEALIENPSLPNNEVYAYAMKKLKSL